jgi:hypothetical protein
MVIFREQLKGKVVDYDLEAYLKRKQDPDSYPEAPKTSEQMLPGM